MTNKQIPTAGTIVLYTLSEDDAKRINKRRDDAIARAHANKEHPEVTGFQTHYGNRVIAGEGCPAIVVRPWGLTPGSAVNLKVFLDGNDDFWATSVTYGEGERHFGYPAVLEAE